MKFKPTKFNQKEIKTNDKLKRVYVLAAQVVRQPMRQSQTS